MSGNVNPELLARTETACHTAEQFVKLFYERMDAKRHAISAYYLESAILSWDGNKVEGSSNIQKFLLDKIPSTDHEIISLDAQPVYDEAVLGQTTVQVHIAGIVGLGQGKRAKPFQQTFLITAQDDKWKIASESFRYQD